MAENIKHRCYKLALSVMLYLKRNKWDVTSFVIVKQLMRSASSIGANAVEATNSSSRVEFKGYYEIALKSANESKYWLCLIKDGNDLKNDKKLDELLIECNELSKILAASVIKLKNAK